MCRDNPVILASMQPVHMFPEIASCSCTRINIVGDIPGGIRFNGDVIFFPARLLEDEVVIMPALTGISCRSSSILGPQEPQGHRSYQRSTGYHRQWHGLKPAFRLTHARGVIADVRRRNRPNVDMLT